MKDVNSPDVLEQYPVCCWLQACARYNITAGVFCIGEERAAQLAAKGFKYVAYDTDLGAMMSYTASIQQRLKPQPAIANSSHATVATTADEMMHQDSS